MIEINNLSKTYGKARGIEDVTLQVGEGEIFGFIGPNGAGKSTTIRILLNLIFPSSGSARIMGMDVIHETKKIKQITGFIPSDANAYPFMEVGTFLEYCTRFYGIHVSNDRTSELLEMFELDPGRKISDLSVGNRKKVAIVQCFLHSPKLLILDEPTSGLDPLMQAKFFDLVRSENKKGVTVFFSSHILSEVQTLCRRVAIIREGKIVRVEDIETLRKKQLKKITIEFADQVGMNNYNIGGMEPPVNRSGNVVTFMFSGDINMLTGSLQGKKITNLMVEEPPLEEIFMHYYR